MNDWIIPDWPAPANVKALFTTRNGGVSRGENDVYASLNLGAHVNDDVTHVTHNRALLRRHLPSEPKWLKQVHGTSPVWIDHAAAATPEGDAVLSRKSGTVCAVMVADCLPVFLCDTAGTTVGIVHAGWRGLAGGIIEQSIAAMQVDHGKLMAWLGPAIGPDHFEVGKDVYDTFVRHDAQAGQAFGPKDSQHEKKWLADIFLLARQRLISAGVTEIYGGDVCTYSDPARFFSYRRDGDTGRMAALIWLA
ncbi:peptidoglycan editing factor PgeF [Nitrosomonas sp. Is35]|uniref:peptidoglycan editing factor PgeF n=1 Tax=Nitrosomonas sp. Is35 TaxID=3080534 RepID=UPI00294AEF4E|nr:peptidoglycan editing factor PgeF [Nitrosomonas sp. Is35]MDV6348451.1 peptidoglycan editing factor PgeF [Nitrosomonas sp. Is35]